MIMRSIKVYILALILASAPLYAGILRADSDIYAAYEEEQLRKLLQDTEEWQRDLMREEAQLSELSRQRAELKLKIKELVRQVAQEKAIAELMLKDIHGDQAKLREIERLWRRATHLYDNERYKEAVELFQKILEIEGDDDKIQKNAP